MQRYYFFSEYARVSRTFLHFSCIFRHFLLFCGVKGLIFHAQWSQQRHTVRRNAVLRCTHEIPHSQPMHEPPFRLLHLPLCRLNVLFGRSGKRRLQAPCLLLVRQFPCRPFCFQVRYHLRVNLVKTLRMVGVPHKRRVKLCLRKSVFLKHLLIILRQRLIMPVVVASHLHDGIRAVQIVQHTAHLPRRQHPAWAAACQAYHAQQKGKQYEPTLSHFSSVATPSRSATHSSRDGKKSAVQLPRR